MCRVTELDGRKTKLISVSFRQDNPYEISNLPKITHLILLDISYEISNVLLSLKIKTISIFTFNLETYKCFLETNTLR